MAASVPALQRHTGTQRPGQKSQRVSRLGAAGRRRIGEAEELSRAEHKTDQSQGRAEQIQCALRSGNQEIPLDTSAFIRHYNEFL